MTNWIRVKDRLPEERQWVLVFMNYGDIEFSRFEDKEWKYSPGTPTHWMPLPELPEEDEND